MQNWIPQTTEEVSKSIFSTYGDNRRFWKNTQILNENNSNSLEKHFDRSLKMIDKEFDQVNSPDSMLDNRSEKMDQPRRIAKVVKRQRHQDMVPESSALVHQNQQLSIESNYSSNVYPQQTLSANSTSHPNSHKMTLQMIQQDNYSMNSQMCSNLYSSTNSQLHPYRLPLTSPHIPPYALSAYSTSYTSPPIESTSDIPQFNPQISRLNPCANPLMNPVRCQVNSYVSSSQYQTRIPEAHFANDKQSYSKSAENVYSSTNLIKPNSSKSLREVRDKQKARNPKASKEVNQRKSKKRRLPKSPEEFIKPPGKKSTSQSSTKEEISRLSLAYQRLVQQNLHSHALSQYDHLIQHKNLAICQQTGPKVTHSLHDKLTERYYSQCLQGCEISYKSKPEPVYADNPLFGPDIAQQWYQALTVLYIQLMKWRHNRAVMAPRAMDYRLDVDESIVDNPQWDAQTPDAAEVAYWNDLIIRRCMGRFANEDPDKFERYVSAKRRELGEIMMGGVMSEKSDV